MTQVAVTEMDKRVTGRRWMVRLDAAGRGGTAVRISCSRPGCAEERLPSATAGRAYAIAHVKAHLRTGPGPRAQAYCACRLEDCRNHVSPADQKQRAEVWRCGGAVVLAVVTDREGRWWQVTECCARCAAAMPNAKVVVTATAAPRPAPAPSTPAAGTAQLFGRVAGDGPSRVPAARLVSPHRQVVRRISQRIIPQDLQPDVLRDELVELGDLFRAYQQGTAPDLSALADLQERKARAFAAWAGVTGDPNLRLEGQRALQAAAAARLQHHYRTRSTTDAASGAPVVRRLLTSPSQWEHARSVLAYAATRTPFPGPEAQLLVLLMTMRAVHSGTGKLIGKDITALGLADPEQLVADLADCGWLELPGTVGELLASPTEAPTPVTVPSLIPGPDRTSLLTFGKRMRPKLSGWAQRVIGDKQLRQADAPAAGRLLALTLATQTSAAGQLGADGGRGIPLGTLHDQVPVDQDEMRHLLDLLTGTDWLTAAVLTDTQLTGQLTERVLPLTCPRI
ncbi:hypothetical protein CIB93_35030 [Streptomyces sp. WZ.A104]|uniref:hypothetical protein n=1 Tax=Streptomyces sp. WZ.A104 TaxID=2023771 RepID=UPI000BBC32A5|nr:hypothetical protein [Streptomyces sp. WZ.A104]PCG81495.1 hypothetical protein CIB93_35030 [Streptomyces sp. WZ.A104]